VGKTTKTTGGVRFDFFAWTSMELRIKDMFKI
jgi:hypothetical protein